MLLAGEAGDVSPWARKTRDKTLRHRVGYRSEYYGNGAGLLLQRSRSFTADGNDHIGHLAHEFRHVVAGAVSIATSPAVRDADVAAICPAGYRKLLRKGRN